MRQRISIVLLLAAVAVTGLQGCTVIGFSIGAIKDAGKPDFIAPPDWQVATIKTGTSVRIILMNGDRLQGTYAGREPVPPEEYAKRYAASREQLSQQVTLPALGDKITLTLSGGRVDNLGHRTRVTLPAGREFEWTFSGFDLGDTPVNTGPGTSGKSTILPAYEVLGVLLKVSNERRVVLHVVSYITDNRGNLIEGRKIAELMAEGKIPMASAMVIRNKEGRSRPALDRIAQIAMPPAKDAKWKGALIGLVIDALIIQTDPAGSGGIAIGKPDE